jgi:hypothetical protein
MIDEQPNCLDRIFRTARVARISAESYGKIGLGFSFVKMRAWLPENLTSGSRQEVARLADELDVAHRDDGFDIGVVRDVALKLGRVRQEGVLIDLLRFTDEMAECVKGLWGPRCARVETAI